MNAFKKLIESTKSEEIQLDEAGNKGTIKGTEISYATKKGKMVRGPFGDEQSYITKFGVYGEDAAIVTAADQGIIDVEIIDEMVLGDLLNALFEI